MVGAWGNGIGDSSGRIVGLWVMSDKKLDLKGGDGIRTHE
jgi:hypothetical protein